MMICGKKLKMHAVWKALQNIRGRFYTITLKARRPVSGLAQCACVWLDAALPLSSQQVFCLRCARPPIRGRAGFLLLNEKLLGLVGRSVWAGLLQNRPKTLDQPACSTLNSADAAGALLHWNIQSQRLYNSLKSIHGCYQATTTNEYISCIIYLMYMFMF